jgi:hemerythrin superfamily protein
MDAIELTLADHRTVEELFGQFEQTQDPAERGRIIQTVIEELSIHAAIEEEIMYPAMRELPDGEELVEHAIEEHLEAKVALAVLGRLSPTSEEFVEKAQEMIDDVRHHVEEEESDLLPRLKEALGPERLQEMGQRMAQAKERAPRRPSADDLTKATKEQLYEAAQVIDLTGRSDMDKDQLASELVGS